MQPCPAPTMAKAALNNQVLIMSERLEPKHCDRCGVLAELPTNASGYCEGIVDGEMTVCIDCLEVSQKSLADFYGVIWYKNKQSRGDT